MSNEKWHVSKSVNLSHIFATGMILIGGFMYIANIDKEVSKHTVQIEAMSDRVSSIDNSHNALFDKIDAKLEKIFDLLYQMKND
jgi:hypothetical protein